MTKLTLETLRALQCLCDERAETARDEGNESFANDLEAMGGACDPDELTIASAVLRAMDEWKRGGTNNVDRMREQIDTLVEEAIGKWQAANIDTTTDEEEDFDDIRDSDPHEAY